MAEYEPVVGDKVRVIVDEHFDHYGKVLAVMHEPCIVLGTADGKQFVIALPAATLERLGT